MKEHLWLKLKIVLAMAAVANVGFAGAPPLTQVSSGANGTPIVGSAPMEQPPGKISAELPPLHKPWNQIYREAKESIPVIFSSGRVCSGALIDKDLVLTAAHCVGNLREVFIFLQSKYQESLAAVVIGFDRRADLALLRLERSSALPFLPIAMKQTLPMIGDEIVTIGHPASPDYFEFPPFDEDSTYLLSRGVVSQLNEKYLISDLSVSPGNSGGPVLNNMGQIVGVVSKKRIDRGVGNIAHIVAPARVQQFILQNRENKTPTSWLGAQTDLDLSVWYNHWASAQPDQRSGTEDFESELSISFWDRLTIGSMQWFGGDVKRDYAWFFGWKFQFPTPALTLWTFTPGLVHWRYQDGERRTGLSLYIDHTYMPLILKLTAAENQGQTDFIWSLGLRFF